MVLLRSVNNQTTTVPTVGGARITTVRYDGPDIDFAVLTGQVDLIGLAFLFGNTLAFGMRIQRLSLLAILTQRETLFCNTGVVATMSDVLMSNLVWGDVIECWVSSQFPDRWAVRANGFSVMVR